MRLLALAIIGLFFPALAVAQVCTPTLAGLQSGPVDLSTNSQVAIGAMTTLDEPGGPSLVVAGFFVVPPAPIVGSTISNVARYHAGQWSSMQAGLPITTSQAMRVLEQADFSGVGGPGPSLYVAGDNGQVYRWTGSQWVSTGSGQGPCYALLSCSDDQGPLLLAGGVSGVMGWRGSGAWTPYGSLGATGTVYALRVVDDGTGPAVFAVGGFRNTARNINCIAKLVNGQWMSYPVNVQSVQFFSDFTSFDDGISGPELFIAGSFSTLTSPNAGVARFHGGNWNIVGTPLIVDGSAFGPTLFKVDEGQGPRLYVGGSFQSQGQFSGLVRLVNTPTPGWQGPVQLTRTSFPPGVVNAITRYDDGQGTKTYFGGVFGFFRTDPTPSAVNTTAFGLIRSTDAASTAFESTAQGLGEIISFPSPAIRYTLSTVDMGQGARLLASTSFVRAGGQLARGAVLYDGAAWSPLNLPFTGGSSQCVQFGVMANIAGQQRLVSGILNSSLGPIGYWDGTQWVRMTFQPPTSSVYGLAVLNDVLYVLGDGGLYHYNVGAVWSPDINGSGSGGSMMVGDFGRGRRLYLTMSGPMGPGLYEYDGTTYARLGTTFSPNPSSMCIHDDGDGPAMYVASPSLPGQVARFQNNTFVAIASSFSSGGSTSLALASFNDGRSPALYIAGQFASSGGVQMNGFARWHAGVVAPVVPFAVGQNTSGLALAGLQVFGNRLYVSGEFYNIGGVSADHLAYIEACPFVCSADFNHDGDVGTDADIFAFFSCLSGTCCSSCGSADFNGDGDVGTDQDIESFFRVLGGGEC